ncbi:MAG: hypothetical protein ACJ8AJ_12660 [Gemmatimonadaceae bacterium]
MNGLLTLVAALSLATISVRIERVAPAPAMWDQELCAPEPLHPCTSGVLQGGWPLPFLLDRPGISVMGQLAFVEDLFRPKWFALDVLVIWLALWALVQFPRWRRAH